MKSGNYPRAARTSRPPFLLSLLANLADDSPDSYIITSLLVVPRPKSYFVHFFLLCPFSCKKGHIGQEDWQISGINSLYLHNSKYARVRDPRPKADLLDRKGRCGCVLCRWKSRRGMEEFAMTQLTDKERTAQMNDMRSFDE